ncbi:hypothetical protein [Desulfosporosinus sp. OT]|uniref:hypothetical protein n=1 Tax=Desulfosporosinus sp. OT TaxID=913865 RepID=UPI000223A9A6|nr:hypothetical protein [Desulfosporosinus sp. OT]EGW36916.1 hypothetical protein DOT_5106 [Desulfosporosinus sp. OT]
MKKLFAITTLIIISFILITSPSAESIERRIVSNTLLYTATTSKAADVLDFIIIPNNYIKQSELGQRKLLMKKYDSEVYLEPLKDMGDEYWISWSFDNNWDKQEGTCFTFRSLQEPDLNGNRLYSDANTKFQAVNENGQSIHGSWGGGGSTYNYGFNVNKEIFNSSKQIKVKLEGFNLMHYKLKN